MTDQKQQPSHAPETPAAEQPAASQPTTTAQAAAKAPQAATVAAQASKPLPSVNKSGGRLIRCRNQRIKAGILQACNQALCYLSWGKVEIKCPRCGQVTEAEIIQS